MVARVSCALAVILGAALSNCHVVYPYRPPAEDHGSSDGMLPDAPRQEARSDKTPPREAQPREMFQPADLPLPGKDAVVPTWKQRNVGVSTNLKAVWGSSSSHVVIVGASGTIVTGAGASWSHQQQSSSTLLAVWGSSSADIYAVGLGSTALHTDMSGWSPLYPAPPASGHSGVWGWSASHVYLVGTTGKVLTGKATSAWSPVDGAVDGNMGGIFGFSATEIYAVGTSGGIYRYSGAKFEPMSPMPSPAPTNLYAVWGAGTGSGKALFVCGLTLGPSTAIYRYDGTSWKTEVSVGSDVCRGGWSSTAVDGIAVFDSGRVLRRDPKGVWSDPSFPKGPKLNGVWGSGPTDIYVVGDSGYVAHYSP